MTRSDPRAVLRHQWGLLLAAVQALTRIPVAVAFGPHTLRDATRFMPLVGIAVGTVTAGLFLAARTGLPSLPAALLAVGATLLLTGALHEDGLADCCDGLGGGRTTADALRIMRDSRIGVFGALGLVIMIGTRTACIATLPHPAFALIAAAAASRFWTVLPPAVLPCAREAGMAAGMAAPGARNLIIAGLFGLGPLLLLGSRTAAALLLSGLVALSIGAYARRRLHGYTGDVLGATQQTTELAVLLAALWHPLAAGPWLAA